MTPTNDIQGNSWTDEPEIPPTKRDGDKQQPKPEPEKPTEPSSEQRPPSDS
jgi:hypothetical protein